METNDTQTPPMKPPLDYAPEPVELEPSTIGASWFIGTFILGFIVGAALGLAAHI